MPHKRIRRARKAVERRKKRAADRRDRVRDRVESAKERASGAKQAVASRAKPIQEEVSQTAQETRLLARELGEPFAAAGRVGQEKAQAAREAAARIEGSAAQLDERFEQIRAIERDTLGMAGEDFGLDLEVVDDFNRGHSDGDMGGVGFDTTFDGLEEEGSLLDVDGDDLDVVGEQSDDDLDDFLEGL